MKAFSSIAFLAPHIFFICSLCFFPSPFFSLFTVCSSFWTGLVPRRCSLKGFPSFLPSTYHRLILLFYMHVTVYYKLYKFGPPQICLLKWIRLLPAALQRTLRSKDLKGGPSNPPIQYVCNRIIHVECIESRISA